MINDKMAVDNSDTSNKNKKRDISEMIVYSGHLSKREFSIL